MEKINRAQEKEKEKQKEQEIWSWGAGTDGQLPTGRLQDEHSPQLLRFLSAFGPFASLSCGGAHVISITPGGTWKSVHMGAGNFWSIGPWGDDKALEGFVVICVSAGWNHSGFVTDIGAVFTCGDGLFGQLGHGDYESKCSPLEVVYFSYKHVEQVACGMRHTLALLKGDVEHKVYRFGSGRRGKLGTSTGIIKSTSVPQVTLCLTDVEIVSICANGDHSAALSENWSARRIEETAVLQIAAGAEHSALVTDNGSVMTWGWGEHGHLGLGDIVDKTCPQLVNLGSEVAGKHATSSVYCGSGFCFLLRNSDVHTQIDVPI